jgi:hypothetical protein
MQMLPQWAQNLNTDDFLNLEADEKSLHLAERECFVSYLESAA